MNIKQIIIIILGVSWVLYSLLIDYTDCFYWIEEFNDGWYVMESTDVGDRYIDVQTEGPFSE